MNNLAAAFARADALLAYTCCYYFFAFFFFFK